MGTVLTAASVYFVGTFALAAALVRFVPQSLASRQIRRRFGLFLLAPLLASFDIARAFQVGVQKAFGILRRSFEILSGRKLLDKEGRTYVYRARSAVSQRKLRQRERDAGSELESISSRN